MTRTTLAVNPNYNMQNNSTTMASRPTVASPSSSSPHHNFGHDSRTRQQENTTHFSNPTYRNNHLYPDHSDFHKESTYKNYPTSFDSKQRLSSSIASAPPNSSPTSIPPVARARSASGSTEGDEESAYQSMLQYQRNSSSGGGSIWRDIPGLKNISDHDDDDNDDDNSSDMDRKPPAIPSPLLARKTKSLVSPRSGSSTNRRGIRGRNTQKDYDNIVEVLRHDVLTIPDEIERREPMRRKGGDMDRPPKQKQRQKQKQHYHRYDNDGFNDLSELQMRRSENNDSVMNHQKRLYKSIEEEQKQQEILNERVQEVKTYEDNNPTLQRTTSPSMYPQQHDHNDLLREDNDGRVLIGPNDTRRTTTIDPYYSTEENTSLFKKQLDIWKEIQAEQDRKQLEKALSISRQANHHITGRDGATQSLSTIGSSNSRSKVHSSATETLARDCLMRNHPQPKEEKVSSADLLISQQLAMEELETKLHQQHVYFASSTTTTGISQSPVNTTSTSRYRTTECPSNTNVNNHTSNDVLLHDSLQRGHIETYQAISRGESHVVRCKGCSARLHTPVGYSLVYCPTCHAVSPGESISNMETSTHNSDEEHGCVRHLYHQTNASAPLRRNSS